MQSISQTKMLCNRASEHTSQWLVLSDTYRTYHNQCYSVTSTYRVELFWENDIPRWLEVLKFLDKKLGLLSFNIKICNMTT